MTYIAGFMAKNSNAIVYTAVLFVVLLFLKKTCAVLIVKIQRIANLRKSSISKYINFGLYPLFPLILVSVWFETSNMLIITIASFLGIFGAALTAIRRMLGNITSFIIIRTKKLVSVCALS